MVDLIFCGTAVTLTPWIFVFLQKPWQRALVASTS